MISRKMLLRNVAGFFVSAKELKERGCKFFKLVVCKIYFRVGFIEALDSKGIINTLKRYYVAVECADVVAFIFAT